VESREGVLGRIVAHKRDEIERRQRETPLDELRLRASPTSRSLREALVKPGARFILEHKRASPSQGALRADVGPSEIACAYEGAADAMSVLTDARFFGGSFEDLRAVRESTDVPILCKDFVVSPYQVVEARTYGADAILILLSVLSDDEARACLAEAHALGMDALVEAHDEAEVRRAIDLPAAIIGINHRDLRTLALDLSASERLAPLVPYDRVVVAESGIESRCEVERLAPRVDAFLVGSALMRAADVRDAARALVFGRVKVCGLTTPDDARLAAAAGATLGGVIFAAESPRCVTLDQAEQIAAEGALPLVGVFVNEAKDRVVATARALGLVAVQLHGDEDAAYLRTLRKRLPQGCAVWKAAHIGPDDAVYSSGTGLCTHGGAAVERYLFDTGSRHARGGTGSPFDWDVISGHPHLAAGLLAGGIGPHNAVAARAVGAWAIDVGSKIEASSGKKDAAKMAELFSSLRGPSRQWPALGCRGPVPGQGPV
jgi:indole-3-glycerol phosphate synthase/phosphoribosylanthranilate isomerase